MNYRVRRTSFGEARLDFQGFGESGKIRLGPTDYWILKQGMFSGRWALQSGGSVWMEARKPSPMFRAFEIRSSEIMCRVQPVSPFGRTFKIYHGNRRVGIISPAHPFTRRATIRCAEEIPELMQLFSFWIVALLWRRASRNNSA